MDRDPRWGGGNYISRYTDCYHQGNFAFSRVTPELFQCLKRKGVDRGRGVRHHQTVSINHNFWREGRTEAEWNRGPSAQQRSVPRWLIFTWWGYCGLRLWHEPTKLVHFFLFSACVLCPFLSLWPFQLYFILWILPTTLRFLILFFLSYFCVITAFELYISVWKSPSALI